MFAITPVVNYLLASLGFFCLFFWAIYQGMFRDIEAPKFTMLENERRLDEEDWIAPARCPTPTGKPDRSCLTRRATPLTHASSRPTEAWLTTWSGRRPFRSTRRRPSRKTASTPTPATPFPGSCECIWIVFWCFAITYVVLWLLPSLQSELLSPP